MQINPDKIKAIIFDLGNVLIPLDWQRAQECFESLGGTITEDNFPLLEKLANDFDRGSLSADQFRHLFSKAMGLENVKKEDFDRCWCAFVLDYPEDRKNLVELLATEFDLYVLSNLNPIHYEHIKTFRTWDEKPFKKLFLSYQMKTRKPEKEIFEKVISQIPHNPEEIIYFDDKKEFVDSARKYIKINALQVNENIHQLVNQIFKITVPLTK